MYQILARKIKHKLELDNDVFEIAVDAFPENCELLISIEKYSGKPTKKQRGYYFAACIKDAAEYFREQYGWDKHELYKWLMSECNIQQVVNKFTGEIKFVAVGLSAIDIDETSEVIDNCIRLLAEHGYIVKTPKEYFENLKNERML